MSGIGITIDSENGVAYMGMPQDVWDKCSGPMIIRKGFGADNIFAVPTFAEDRKDKASTFQGDIAVMDVVVVSQHNGRVRLNLIGGAQLETMFEVFRDGFYRLSWNGHGWTGDWHRPVKRIKRGAARKARETFSILLEDGDSTLTFRVPLTQRLRAMNLIQSELGGEVASDA
jgi:hypothetical protein